MLPLNPSLFQNFHPPLTNYDLAIIGGGIAGLSLSILMARSYQSVALIEQETIPQKLFCSSFLAKKTLTALQKIGCLQEIENRGVKLQSLHIFSPNGIKIEVPSPGIGLSRSKLEAILLATAKRFRVHTLTNTTVLQISKKTNSLELKRQFLQKKEQLTLPLIISACGENSKLLPPLNRSKAFPYLSFFGKFQTIDTANGRLLKEELHEKRELYVFPGGFGGLTPIEEGEIVLWIYLQKKAAQHFESKSKIDWQHLPFFLQSNSPSFYRRLRDLRVMESQSLIATTTNFSLQEQTKIMSLGDAAGIYVPFSGDSAFSALQSAILLQNTLIKTPDIQAEPEKLLKHWEKRWYAEFAGRFYLERGLQQMINRKWFNELLFRLLKKRIGISQWFFGV